MTPFEKVLAEAVVNRERQEAAYKDKKAADFKRFNQLCQMSDLLGCRYRHRDMMDFHGVELTKAELKQQIVELGGLAI